MIKDFLHNGTTQRIRKIRDNNLNDSDLLRGIVGRNLLLANRKQGITYNEVRWTSSQDGKTVNLADLSITDHYKVEFQNQEIKGDRAINTSSGWTFTASVGGTYRLSTNLKFDLFNFDESSTYNLYDNYIGTLEPIIYGFYRNGSLIQPSNNELEISSWNPHLASDPYHIQHNRSTYRFIGRQDIMYYLDAGDEIDIRVGFTQLIGIAVQTLTTSGDVNINLLSRNRDNKTRILYGS